MFAFRNLIRQAHGNHSTGPASPDDYAIIGDLLETVEQDPGCIQARMLLAQQYEAFGWDDAAADEIRAILTLQPGDSQATAWLTAHVHGSETSANRPQRRKHVESKSPVAVDAKTVKSLQEMEAGYKSLMAEAQELCVELRAFEEMCGPQMSLSGSIADLKAVAEGRCTSVVKIRPPPAARATATKMQSGEKANAIQVAFSDLETNARWLRSRNESQSEDDIRSAILKRASAIKALIDKDTGQSVEDAFMHIEHEVLQKTYQNESGQTMLGDAISDIPRANFWSSEDGYAWDMSELAEAIKVNNGVMRNPLSKQMFAADDVRAIVRHPMGKKLAALQLEQKQLTQGIRKETVDRLDRMAKIMLDDQSADSAASREAVEEFSIYAATLPQAEQDALDKLKVPATDSHTGQPFDTAIGSAVADAKANRQCFHKTADLLRQAATYLRNNSSGPAKMPHAW